MANGLFIACITCFVQDGVDESVNCNTDRLTLNQESSTLVRLMFESKK